MRSVRRLAAVAATILALTLLVPSVAAVAPHSGTLHLEKECSKYTGAAGGYCTFTSPFDAITVGSRIYYSSAATNAGVDSDVVIVVGHGTTATGHCTLVIAALPGQCSFWKGTGRLAGFHALVSVSTKDGVNWAWDGTYGYH